MDSTCPKQEVKDLKQMTTNNCISTKPEILKHKESKTEEPLPFAGREKKEETEEEEEEDCKSSYSRSNSVDNENSTEETNEENTTETSSDFGSMENLSLFDETFNNLEFKKQDMSFRTDRHHTLPPRNEQETEKITQKMIEIQRTIQRKMIDEQLKKKGRKGKGKFSKKDDLRRKKMIEKMSKLIKKGTEKEKKALKKVETNAKKREKFLKDSSIIWKNKIIPHFEEYLERESTIKLWKCGLPPSIRGIVWKKAIFSKGKLIVTKELFKRLKHQDLEKSIPNAKEVKALIDIDLQRTYPELQFFQKNGPYHESFKLVLYSWVKYRSEIGYVQGMSYLVAVLLLNMSPFEAFQSFVNLMLSSSFHFFGMYSISKQVVDKFTFNFNYFAKKKIRKVYNHLRKQKIVLDVCLINWFMTLFAKSFPLTIACRVWDQYLLPKDLGGEVFLYRAMIGIFKYFKKKILKLEYDEIMYFLSHIEIEEKEIDEKRFFHCINSIKIEKKELDKINRI